MRLKRVQGTTQFKKSKFQPKSRPEDINMLDHHHVTKASQESKSLQKSSKAVL